MAWLNAGDGTKRCTECDAVFKPPAACACPHRSTRAPGDVRLGPMESMTEQARALGLGDRLGLEKHLANRIRRADSEARNYLRFMRAAMERSDEQNAHKWAALAESARGRGDKIARAYLAVVSDREQRADLERHERNTEALRSVARVPRVRGAA